MALELVVYARRDAGLTHAGSHRAAGAECDGSLALVRDVTGHRVQGRSLGQPIHEASDVHVGVVWAVLHVLTRDLAVQRKRLGERIARSDVVEIRLARRGGLAVTVQHATAHLRRTDPRPATDDRALVGVVAAG